METVKDVLNFCNAAMSYGYKNIGIIDELNQARRCIVNTFHETIPVSRILIFLSILDVVISKIIDNDIEILIEKFDDSRSNIIHMIGFEKLVKNNLDKVMK